MLVYRSAPLDVVEGGRTRHTWAALQAGADGAAIPLTANLALVSSDTSIAAPPAGVALLFDWPADRNTLVPNGVINFINTNLSLSIPLGVHTWGQLVRRLFKSDGAGKWLTLASDARDLWMGRGSIDVT